MAKRLSGQLLEGELNWYEVIALPPWKRPVCPPSEQWTPGPSVARNQFSCSRFHLSILIMRALTMTPEGQAHRTRVFIEVPSDLEDGSRANMEPRRKGQLQGMAKEEANE